MSHDRQPAAVSGGLRAVPLHVERALPIDPALHLTFVRRGFSLARVTGELLFDNDLRLVVLERITFDRSPALIDGYGYEVWRGEEKLYWYDPQPHPNKPSLQSTHPHHKHVPPDIKHNRIPAPGMSFTHPNLPGLIREIEALLADLGRPTGP